MLRTLAEDGSTFVRNQQPFIAYRAQSDEFEILFVGGPLDGTSITTDISPNRDWFIHRVRERTYVYRYLQVSPHVFYANLDGFEVPPTKTNDR